MKEGSKMFNNPGSKIKQVATFLFWLEGIVGTLAILISFAISISASSYIVNEQSAPLVYILFILVMLLAIGVLWLICWIIYLLLYGYGELIEKTTDNEVAIQDCNKKLDTMINIMNEPTPVAKRDFHFDIES